MTPQDLQTPLSTTRLTLRKFVPADFDAYAAYHTLPAVYRFLYADAPGGAALNDQFSQIIDAPFAQDGDTFRLAVVRRDDNALIGEVLLKLASKAALQAEVGYIFHPAYAGRGYATEAVAAIIDLAFQHFDFHRVFARLDAANQGSVGVVERLGLRREAHLVQNDRFNDIWGDEYIYATLQSEWTARTR